MLTRRRFTSRSRSVAGFHLPFLLAGLIFPMLDLSNQHFGRLTVLDRADHPGRKAYWRCRCACGVVKEVRGDALRADGGTRSCGCLQREAVSALGHHHRPGERFGRLRIIKQVGTLRKRGRVYRCLCDCGQRVKVQGRFLRDGLIRSCGCLYNETRTTNIRHGQCRITRKTATYNAYQRQKHQCQNPNGRQARYFFHKGIEFRFDDFLSFYAEVGDKPGPDFWLVRIDGDGHFEPGNLHWREIKRHRRKLRRKPRH
jgi:hypothetical protein